MEKYNLEQAQQEAELLKQKVESGESLSYQSAEDVIEHKKALEGLKQSLVYRLDQIKEGKDHFLPAQHCSVLIDRLKEIGRPDLAHRLNIEGMPQWIIFSLKHLTVELGVKTDKESIEEFGTNCSHLFKRTYWIFRRSKENDVLLKLITKFLGEVYAESLGSTNVPTEYFEELGDNERANQVRDLYTENYHIRERYLEEHGKEVSDKLRELAGNLEEGIKQNFKEVSLEQVLIEIINEIEKDIEKI